MSQSWSDSRLRFAGLAGVAGGLAWALLAVATVAADRGTPPLWYGFLDALAPVAFALSAVGVAGYHARTNAEWGRLATVGYVAVLAGLVGAFAGSAAYAGLGTLDGWTVSVWAYLLAVVGAPVFGVGLLRAGIAPRSGAVLLAGGPVVVAAAFGLAALVGDEALVSVGLAVWLGASVAALGWWVWTGEGEEENDEKTEKEEENEEERENEEVDGKKRREGRNEERENDEGKEEE